MNAFNPDRRRFLKLGAGITGASLVLGVNWSCTADAPDADSASPDGFMPNAWLRIDTQGFVTVIVAESEMGQGPYTALPMMVAEELEVEWRQVGVEHASLAPVYGRQVTGGSTSVSKAWTILRQAGAIARTMLLQAAAEGWQVPLDECRAERGKVVHPGSGREQSYGQLTAVAASLPMPDSVQLKRPSDYRIIGTPVPRLDSPQKINGSARFGIDTRLPGMRYATITHCPVFGGKAKNIDASRALDINGVLDVFSIEQGVVVVAKDTWTAFKGRAALDIEWESGDTQTLSNRSILDDLQKLKVEEGSAAAVWVGEPESALDGAALESRYSLPFQAHVPLEPINCTASFEAGKLRIWAPTQAPTRAYDAAQEVVQSKLTQAANKLKRKLFDAEDTSIEINTTLLGGGFGRRLKQDYVTEVAQIAERVDGPVQLIWTREEDLQHDFYHPLTLHEMRGALDSRGRPLAWHHTIKGTGARLGGADALPYDIPHIRVDLIDLDTPVPVGPWRSVQHHYNAFAVEHFFDELARAGGQDPLQLRLQMMSQAPRLRKTLEVAAEKAGWDYDSGLFGAAAHAGFGSYASEVVHLRPEGTRLKIAKVTCVVDCGIVVNPDIARAQLEGAIIFGLSAALKSSIEVEGGSVRQSNFHNYPILTMAETPPMEIVFIDSRESPGGIGEPGVPPLAPALANALMAASGRPVRELPLDFDHSGIRVA
ncbi:MAG: xanthine dehydrogenase family protein molybdopterin-binding subunit [Candidatus Thiodiazotropha sp.]